MADLAWLRLQGKPTSLTQHPSSGRVARNVMRWAHPFSFATTKGIPFGFFSSAY